MYQIINGLLKHVGLNHFNVLISNILTVITILILCFVIRLFMNYLLTKVFIRTAQWLKYTWIEILYHNKLFHRISNLVIPVIMISYNSDIDAIHNLTIKTAGITGVIIIIFLFESLINSVDEIYRNYEVSKIRPIRGFLQVIKTAMFIVGGITGAAILVGKSPFVLLGSIGAMAAVTSFIFKDAILGFVAGIQLTTNDLVRIGDWIEIPKYAAGGTVIDLSMTTVKIENSDKTITSIPAYTLMTEAFINCRGMEDYGARRIKRAIHINVADIKQCDDTMLHSLQNITFLKNYIENKIMELTIYNRNYEPDSSPVNGRQLTNIGTFRAYITEYLKHHPGIHKDMVIMVRQREMNDRGLPLEIYAFTNTTKWDDYESIQSDIFDHLYSMVSNFGLRIYQKPSGYDVIHAGKDKVAE